jgi:hypothetical protein
MLDPLTLFVLGTHISNVNSNLYFESCFLQCILITIMILSVYHCFFINSDKITECILIIIVLYMFFPHLHASRHELLYKVAYDDISTCDQLENFTKTELKYAIPDEIIKICRSNEGVWNRRTDSRSRPNPSNIKKSTEYSQQ